MPLFLFAKGVGNIAKDVGKFAEGVVFIAEGAGKQKQAHEIRNTYGGCPDFFVSLSPVTLD